MKQNKVKLTGLWSKKQKNGDTYLDAKLGGSYVQIFKNTYKSKDSDPDYIMYLAEPMRRDGSDIQDSGIDE